MTGIRDLQYKVAYLRLTLDDCSMCLKNQDDPNLSSTCTEYSEDENDNILEELKEARDSNVHLQYIFPECDNIVAKEARSSGTKMSGRSCIIDQKNLTEIIVPGMGGVHGPLIQKWLQENFEEDHDANLPRGHMYTAYLACCELYGIKPVNAATFGKVVRTVFPEVKTRRIGVRGHSKYHYSGIKPKITKKKSLIDKARETKTAKDRLYNDLLDCLQQVRVGFTKSQVQDIGAKVVHGFCGVLWYISPFHDRFRERALKTLQFPSIESLHTKTEALQDIYLSLNTFPTSEELKLPSKESEKAREFVRMYKTHAASILDCILKANFYQIQDVILNFWRSLSLSQLALFIHPEMVMLVRECDHVLFTAVNDIIIPDICCLLPTGLMQALKDFVQNLQYWIEEGFSLMPKALTKAKIEGAIDFKISILRQLQINHMIVAAQRILEVEEANLGLYDDWLILPVEDIVTKCCSVMHGDPEKLARSIRRYTAEFRQFLSQKCTISQMLKWVEAIVTEYKQQRQNEEDDRTMALQWYFLSSHILSHFAENQIRYFGTFHLLDILLKDYAVYLLQKNKK